MADFSPLSPEQVKLAGQEIVVALSPPAALDAKQRDLAVNELADIVLTVEALREELAAAEEALELKAQEFLALIGDAEAERDRLRDALAQYADPKNWGIERDEAFEYPRSSWIGPGSDRTIPDAPMLARAALAGEAEQ